MVLGVRSVKRSALILRPAERPAALVSSARIGLRYPLPEDYLAWAALRAQSRDFLMPWEPAWLDDELSRTAFRRRLKLYARAIRAEEAHPFFLIRKSDRRLIGGLTLSNIRRGVTQSCALGYWIGQPFAGQGYMTEAVNSAIRFAFGPLGLHRIEAATLPANEASRRILLRCGFAEEGYGRRYLKINGAWQDHVLYALLESDPGG
jgi:[ribosomal protein S5]-alanine N-acetyltransferase